MKMGGVSRFDRDVVQAPMRCQRLVAIVLVATLALTSSLTVAQVVLPTVEQTITPEVIQIGDPVTVVVTVTHDPDAEVVFPEPLDLAPFEVLGEVRLSEEADEQLNRSRLELAVTAFELGVLPFPPLELEVASPTGDSVVVVTEGTAVTVESVGRDESGELRDIKGPLAIPFEVLRLLPWLIMAAVAAFLVIWFYRRRRQRTPSEVPVGGIPQPPAHLVAWESLDALEASGLLEAGNIKTYHIRLSDIMRVYVNGRFGLDAMEMTTGEVVTGLRHQGIESSIVTQFRQVLDRCDLVKFAKFQPDLSECLDLMVLARGLVDATKPVEPLVSDTPETSQVA